MKHPPISWRELNDTDAPGEILDVIPAAVVGDEDKRRALMDLIDDLPGKYRRPLMMRYYEGMRRSEIGEILGIPATAVDNHLRAARKFLRTGIEERFGAESKTPFPAPALAIGPALLTVFERSAAELPEGIAGAVLAGAGIGAAAPGIPARGNRFANAANGVLAAAVALTAAAALSFSVRNMPDSAPAGTDAAAEYRQTEIPEPMRPDAEDPENAPFLASVSGYVSDGGEPLPEGLSVTLIGESGEEIASRPLEADGSFRFEGLVLEEAGAYTIHVGASSGQLSGNPIEDAVIEIGPGGSGSGGKDGS